MRYTVPHYYGKFRCTASECEDTCCAGWQIVIDDKTLKKYKKTKGPFGNRLYNSIDWKEKSFYQYDGRCAFLNEDNLCDIYMEAGPKMFCRTCRLYPRHIEEFEGEKEISLSLSCIEAAKIVLGCEEPVRFLTKEREEHQKEEDFDYFLYSKLVDTREVLFKILQNRTMDLRYRMAIALVLVHDVELKIKNQSFFEVDEVLERYMKEGAQEKLIEKIKKYKITSEERFDHIKEMFEIFSKLEVLQTKWPEYLALIQETLFSKGNIEYGKNRNEFFKKAGYESDKKKVWEQINEQLIVYFVFTYFCGAVYDEHAYAKMKFAVVSTLLIQEICQSEWQKNGGIIEFKDFVYISHLYSKEVEHSNENLETVENILRTDRNYGTEKLLSLIL